MYHIGHRLQDINSRNVHDLDPDLQNRPRSNVNMPIERPRVGFYVLQYQCTRFQSLTLKMKVDDLDESLLANHLVNVHTCAKIGTCRRSHLFEVHFVTYGWTEARTHALPASIYNSTLLERCKCLQLTDKHTPTKKSTELQQTV